MKYEEALKKIQAQKPKDNYLVVQFSYATKILFPYKEAVSFLAALTNAEQLDDSYGKPKRINELEKDSISINILSHQEYQRLKIAALLNISPDEVKEFENKEVAEPA